MRQIADLAGEKFGRLTVLSPLFRERKDGRRRVYWACVCDCGASTVVLSDTLKNGKSASCGCGNKETRFHLTHGHSRANDGSPSLTYSSWVRMKDRCLNSNHDQFHRYGGRGLRICARWLSSFENFLADMGERPSQKHSIDRIDNDGNYEPSNCKWATPKEQAANRSPVRARR